MPATMASLFTKLSSDGGLARIVSDPAATDYVSVEPIFEPEAALGATTPVERELSE